MFAIPSTAAASSGWHTRAQAERNILNAPRALKRWSSQLVNPKTLVVRQNVSVTCRGLGPVHVGERFTRFTCTIRYHSVRFRVIYAAQLSNGFELHGRHSAHP